MECAVIHFICNINQEMCCLSTLMVGWNPLRNSLTVTKVGCLAHSQTPVGSRNIKLQDFLAFSMPLKLRRTTIV